MGETYEINYPDPKTSETKTIQVPKHVDRNVALQLLVLANNKGHFFQMED